MTRFLKEYAGTHWITWTVIIALLSAPFFSVRIRKLSIVWLQIANFALAFAVGAGLSGTAHSMTGDTAMAISAFYAFGIAYSILALRRKEAFERIVGLIGLAAFGVMVAMTVLHQTRRM